jgi:leader peptidase (prepilin peptidase)/N-methyltransferase
MSIRGRFSDHGLVDRDLRSSRQSRFGGAPLIGAIGVGAVWASFAIAPGWLGFVGSALGVLMLAIAVIDRRRFIIPDQLNALAFVTGLIAVAVNGEVFEAEAITNAILRAAVMFGIFFVFRAGYRSLRGREGMGFGDVKLAAVAGVWLDWTNLPIAVDIAALSALGSVLFSRIMGREWKQAEKLPFGLFFAPAIWVCWLFSFWRQS